MRFPSFLSKGITRLMPFLLLTACGLQARGTVTNVAWYRLGENDPGATSGAVITGSTTNVFGPLALLPINSPRYTNATSTNALEGLASSLAANFNGVNQFLSNSVLMTDINNFGIEAWVKPNATNNAFAFIGFNGTSTGGWGVLQSGNGYYGYIQLNPNNSYVGTVAAAAGTAVPGTWTHVALVRDNGTNKFYINGTLMQATTTAPTTPSGTFTVGFQAHRAGSYFDGSIDEVRVFRFAPGGFSTNDLHFNKKFVTTLLPEPLVSNAFVKGQVEPFGFTTTGWFEIGTDTNYGSVTAPKLTTGFFEQNLTNLAPTVIYHARAVASNAMFGLAYGKDVEFSLASAVPDVSSGSLAWGDQNNDGQLDLVLTGLGTNGSPVFPVHVLCRRTNGVFYITGGGTAAYLSSTAWGDCDNDGVLDRIVTGRNTSSSNSVVYRSSLSTFNVYPAQNGASKWGDFDNNGQLDFAIGEGTVYQAGLSIYRPTTNGASTTFYAAGASLGDSLDVGDYDKDGWLDILYNGRVWRNLGPDNFSVPTTTVYAMGSSAWGDFDNDGRLDYLVTGTTNNGPSGASTEIWRNTGSGFVQINTSLPAVYLSSAAWGDYDNDGWSDIILTGIGTNGHGLSQIWRNTGSAFSNVNVNLPQVGRSSVAWGDYDNDGRLDLALCGTNTLAANSSITYFWKNDFPVTNTSPNPPTGLLATLGEGQVHFSWNSASDAQTPTAALTYNIRIGTTPGGCEIASPMSSSTGWRRVPQMGNTGFNRFKQLKILLKSGDAVYWSVQTVDNAFAGSAWAPEQSFRLTQWEAPVIFTTNMSGPIPVGDYNGNGVIDANELAIVQSNYFVTSPWLQLTNVAGLGTSNVTFALTNSLDGALFVEYATNLSSPNWTPLGPALPRFQFTDTNAPAQEERFYRLRLP